MTAMKKMVLFFLVLTVCVCQVPVCWGTQEEISFISSLSEEEKAYAERMEVTLLTNQPQRLRGFDCFDVCEDGRVAIGWDDSSRDQVLVYDKDGAFAFGVAFAGGGSFDVRFSGGDLMIYQVRSSHVLTFSPEGNCIRINPVPDHERTLWMDYRIGRKNEITVSGRTYRMERDLGMRYSRVTVQEADKTIWCMYDATVDQNGYVVACCIIAAGLMGIAFLNKRHKRIEQ